MLTLWWRQSQRLVIRGLDSGICSRSKSVLFLKKKWYWARGPMVGGGWITTLRVCLCVLGGYAVGR